MSSKIIRKLYTEANELTVTVSFKDRSLNTIDWDSIKSRYQDQQLNEETNEYEIINPLTWGEIEIEEL